MKQPKWVLLNVERPEANEDGLDGLIRLIRNAFSRDPWKAFATLLQEHKQTHPASLLLAEGTVLLSLEKGLSEFLRLAQAANAYPCRVLFFEEKPDWLVLVEK